MGMTAYFDCADISLTLFYVTLCCVQNFVEHIGDYIADICYLACRHKVKLEAAFLNAALAVEIMEGIASSLYPDIQVVSTAMPLVVKAEMMHRLPISWRA